MERLKSKYEKLYHMVLKIFDSERVLLQKARTLNKEVKHRHKSRGMPASSTRGSDMVSTVHYLELLYHVQCCRLRPSLCHHSLVCVNRLATIRTNSSVSQSLRNSRRCLTELHTDRVMSGGASIGSFGDHPVLLCRMSWSHYGQRWLRLMQSDKLSRSRCPQNSINSES